MGRCVQPYRANNHLRLLRCPRSILLMFGAALILSSCGDSAKRVLGLERTAPDEFAVVKRAPLSQPPDFKLRPPRPGSERPGVATPREQARQAIFRGEEANAASASARRNEGPPTVAAPQGVVSQRSTGESVFLTRAGADNVEPDIRSKVDREYSILADADLNFVQKLLDFEPDNDAIVDAAGESRRLRENQALGRDATEGDTPLIDRKTNQLFKVF
jgi:hypothetical protein